MGPARKSSDSTAEVIAGCLACLIRFCFLAGQLGGNKLLKTLSADPPVRIIPIAYIMIGIVTLVKRPPANLAVIVTPSIRKEIDLLWIKLLPPILADSASILVDKRCTRTPDLSMPILGQAPLHRMCYILRLPQGTVNQDGGLIAGYGRVHTV